MVVASWWRQQSSSLRYWTDWWLGTSMFPLTGPALQVTAVIGHTAASEKMLRRKQKAWLSCALGPHSSLLLRMSLSWAWKRLLSPEELWPPPSFEEGCLCYICKSESGGAIPVQLFYLFEALACIEEKIATCFLKKLLRCNIRCWKARSFLTFSRRKSL